MKSLLDKLKKNNPTIEIKEETEHYNIEKAWSDESFMFRFQKDIDLSGLDTIEFPTELCAIFHKDINSLELIYSPLSDKHAHLARRVTYYYEGIEFITEFKEPTSQFILIAKAFKELDSPSVSGYRNLRMFRDFYREDLQTSQMKSYFKNKKPYNFFITGDFKSIKYEFTSFCKHLNVYMRFFDRKSPVINIINLDPNTDTYKVPCKTELISLPTEIAINKIDQVAIDLLYIADETGNSRLKYLFYYQVIEYFAYYYLDEELKRKLSNLLKSPDMLHNYSNYSKIIIEELKDHSNNTTDKQKFSKLISDYIVIDDIQGEIKCNIDYFKKDTEFDGFFKLSSLIADEKLFDKIYSDSKETKEKKKEKEKLKQELINAIADRLEKIRNVLVHIRESRENKVIYPTKNNNKKLLPYLYLIKRIAEIIAMKYNY
jgi:hypothetical protein